MNKQVLVGFDPGLASCGFGVIETDRSKVRHIAHGVITTAAGEAEEKRLFQLYREIRAHISDFSPNAAAVESLFFAKNVKSAISVAQARGVILAACAEREIPVYSFSPLQIKQRVSGAGSAKKNQVQMMIKILLGLSSIPESDHAADALAAAFCLWQERSHSDIISS